jgi:hypothetical protein
MQAASLSLSITCDKKERLKIPALQVCICTSTKRYYAPKFFEEPAPAVKATSVLLSR